MVDAIKTFFIAIGVFTVGFMVVTVLMKLEWEPLKH